MEAWKGNNFFSYRALLIILVFISLIGLFVLKTSTLPAQEKCRLLQEKLSSLEQEVDRMREVNRSLREEKEALENDPFYIELLARDKLKMEGNRVEYVLPVNPDPEPGRENKARQ